MIDIWTRRAFTMVSLLLHTEDITADVFRENARALRVSMWDGAAMSNNFVLR